jgi:predicted TPR repeat methyltransferase
MNNHMTHSLTVLTRRPSPDAYVQSEPNNAFGHFELGVMQERSGQVSAALTSFERSLHLGSDFGQEFRMALQSKISELKRLTTAERDYGISSQDGSSTA